MKLDFDITKKLRSPPPLPVLSIQAKLLVVVIMIIITE